MQPVERRNECVYVRVWCESLAFAICVVIDPHAALFRTCSITAQLFIKISKGTYAHVKHMQQHIHTEQKQKRKKKKKERKKEDKETYLNTCIHT